MKHILIIITSIGLSSCTAAGFISDIVINDEIEKLDTQYEKLNVKKEDTVKGIEHNNNAKDIEKSEKAKKKEDSKKNRSAFPLTEAGWEMDKLIIKNIFSHEDETKNTKKDVDDRACPEKNSRQICTATKGCWCEKK